MYSKGVLRKKLYGYNLKLEYGMRNLACGDQWILLVVTRHVLRRVEIEEIIYWQTGSCVHGFVSRGKEGGGGGEGSVAIGIAMYLYLGDSSWEVYMQKKKWQSKEELLCK